MSEFTHFDECGNARMVDVGGKEDTERIAVAKGSIFVSEEVYRAVMQKEVSKGDVLTVATTAGIMGTKKAPELIPMCHILQLTGVKIEWEMKENSEGSYGRKNNTHEIICTCKVKCSGKTGVEMEALTGVSTALLTVYDMCKAIDKTMEIGKIFLAEKNGGKSGHFFNGNFNNSI